MINNVYSYYMSHYASKAVSRHDTHKKSELKNVYNKMISINKSSPLYKIDFSEDAQKFLIDVKESARELSNITGDLTDTTDGTFTIRQIAESEDNDVVTAKYIGEGKAPITSFDVSVKQLASTQINTGHYLSPSSKELKEGPYSFDLDIGDVGYEFQFNVTSSDKTVDLQNKLARLINRSDMGLSAAVLTDSLGNTALQIESDATGTSAFSPVIFTISDQDTTQQSGSVEYLGLNRTTQYPANAVFSVNGEERTSTSNTFTINKTFELSLKGVNNDGESTRINIKEDSEALALNLNDLICSFNNVINLARNNTEKYNGSAKLYNELNSITRHYQETLNSNGLKVTDNGNIELDTSALSNVTSSTSVTDALKALDGFKSALQIKAADIEINPMDYVNKKIVAYKNPAQTFANPYNNSTYAGMFFDGLC